MQFLYQANEAICTGVPREPQRDPSNHRLYKHGIYVTDTTAIYQGSTANDRRNLRNAGWVGPSNNFDELFSPVYLVSTNEVQNSF